jgi:hypothetical protein
MARQDDSDSIVEFGIQTPNSKTVLMVTLDLAEAEQVLDLLGGGYLVRRTVSCTRWLPIADDVGARVAMPNSPAAVDEPTRSVMRMPLVG